MKIIDTHAHLWCNPQGLDRVAESGQKNRNTTSPAKQR